MEESIASNPSIESQGTESTTVGADGEAQSVTSYLDGKYESVSALENGYKELQSSYSKKTQEYKEGLAGFSGAPDEYALPEGYDGEDTFDNLKEWGLKNGLNNDAFNELISLSDADAQAQHEAHISEQREALGKDADIRIQNVVDWAKANLGEDTMGTLDEMVGTAAGVELFEKIAKISQGTSAAQVAQPKTMVDRDTVKNMRFANDEFGNRRMSSDPQYRAKVEAMEAEFIKSGGKL